MSASRKAGYYWVKYVSQEHWSIEYWNGGMWFTRNPHIVKDSMFSTIDETPIVREQKQSKQQSNCNLPQVMPTLPSDEEIKGATCGITAYYTEETTAIMACNELNEWWKHRWNKAHGQ